MHLNFNHFFHKIFKTFMFVEIAGAECRVRALRARQMLRARLPVIIFQAGRSRPKASSPCPVEAELGQII